MRKAYYFWHSMPSHHQSAHLRGLAIDNDVHLFLDRMDSPMRAAMGCPTPSHANVRIRQSGDAQEIRGVLHHQPPEAVNVVCGRGRECAAARTTLEWNGSRGRPTVVVYEAGEIGDWLSIPRRIYYSMRARSLARQPLLLLGMGGVGVSWFVRVGFPAARVREFAYPVDEGHVLEQSDANRTQCDTVRLTFVGSLIRRKRVDLLLQALTNLPGRWRLQVIGDRPERDSLRAHADQAGLAERIDWHGSLANDSAMSYLRMSDALILPSRHDGWGAVVGEALSHGARVVVSDACGSAALIRGAEQGFTFRSGDASDLRRRVAVIIENGPRAAQDRVQLANWARCVQGPAM